MACVDDLLSAVAEVDDPHIPTEIHRMCTSVVQIVRILCATPPEQKTPLLDEYDVRQAFWK